MSSTKSDSAHWLGWDESRESTYMVFKIDTVLHFRIALLEAFLTM